MGNSDNRVLGQSQEGGEVSARLTEAQAGALFAAAEPAFRPDSGSASRGWQPPAVEELQKALPQYEIQSLLGRGGMGAVYKGIQISLSRPVAIKVLAAEVADELGFSERFLHEARAMARLSHPHIVAVHEAGQAGNGLLYFVMEYVEGQDLGRMLAEQGKLDSAKSVEVAVAVCDALIFAHEEGLVHRDIKPSNILLDSRGRVKVADFGLAKAVHPDATLLTLSDMALGTPDFVAPELLTPGMAVDGRADIYALGVTLYQMLTGLIPRGRFQLPSGLVPGLDPRLDAVIDKALQTNPEHRYASAAAMKRDLEAATAASTAGAPQGPVRSGKLWLGAAAALAVAAAAATAGWVVFEGDKGPRYKPAKKKRAVDIAAVKPASTPPEAAAAKAKALERPAKDTAEWQAFNAWRDRAHKPGKIRAAGTALNGQPFDLTAAEPFADFVQVVVLEESNNPRRTWVGLRANGKALWADGTLTTGHIGLVRNWRYIAMITTHGKVQLDDFAVPQVPVTRFAFGRLQYLQGKPFVAAYEEPGGKWLVQSPALKAGLMLPDLNAVPKIVKVVVDHAGVGVLREDGTLRIWNQQEMKLPAQLGQGIRDVEPLGSSWAVLTRDGRVVNFSVLDGSNALREPGSIREFLNTGGTAVALGSAGYTPLIKHADGSWSTHPSLRVINETLKQLNQQKNESFSAFSANGVEGVLWIEPVEQPEI
jgi:predicted Ser/Thr protein kinase